MRTDLDALAQLFHGVEHDQGGADPLSGIVPLHGIILWPSTRAIPYGFEEWTDDTPPTGAKYIQRTK